VDKTTAGQKGSGGLQDVELKRRVGGIYGGGGGGGGREKEREGKEDDDRLKHFWSIGFWSIGSQPGANCVFEPLASWQFGMCGPRSLCALEEATVLPFHILADTPQQPPHTQSWPQSILFFITTAFSKNLSSFPTPNINPPPPCPIPTSTPRSD